MKTRKGPAILTWISLISFLLVWFAIVCSSIYAGGGGEPAYKVVRWLAGLGPE
jgi:hypothetical protein